MRAFCITVEELKHNIRQLEQQQEEIASMIAGQSMAEEQQAIHLAFEENGRLIWQLGQELLRLVCI
jgi:hypothetical protein